MIYDVVVIGAGPAGLSAGLYASRAKLSTLLIEKMYPGGQAANTYIIENYPGFAEGITGSELADRLKVQAEKFGAELINGDVKELKKLDDRFLINMKRDSLEARSVILAMGAEPRKLGVKGENEFVGRGVSYCATCDGAFYMNKPIIMVGGGDTAIEEALFLTRFASQITVIHRRNELRATKILQDRAFSNEKINFVWDSVVEEIKGKDALEEVVVKNVKTGELKSVYGAGIFVAIGYTPNNDLVKDLVELDDNGYVITDDRMNTSLPGVFAAGDLRQKALRQVVTAVS
ncbi:MAG: thioredoxin-disulfide reductase, partial [Tepidanaerobacteraceae bacterium]